MQVQIIKSIARILVGLGTTSIVNQMVRNNVVPGSIFTKITISAATIAAGGLIGETLSHYTEEKIDEVIEVIEDLRDPKKPASS